MKRDTIKDLVKDLEENIYCRLKLSSIHGVGIFAIRDIPKHTDPFKSFLSYQFVPVNADVIFKNKKIDPVVKKLVSDMYAVVDGKIYLYRGGFNAIGIGFFLNHSKKPNLMVSEDGEQFLTARKIKKGEELLSDHQTYSDNFVRI
jgi:hypothetical protein